MATLGTASPDHCVLLLCNHAGRSVPRETTGHHHSGTVLLPQKDNCSFCPPAANMTALPGEEKAETPHLSTLRKTAQGKKKKQKFPKPLTSLDLNNSPAINPATITISRKTKAELEDEISETQTRHPCPSPLYPKGVLKSVLIKATLTGIPPKLLSVLVNVQLEYGEGRRGRRGQGEGGRKTWAGQCFLYQI